MRLCKRELASKKCLLGGFLMQAAAVGYFLLLGAP